MRAALLRYRVMAYLVGIGLLVLVFVGIPLRYGAGHPGVVAVVGPLHGFLYIVYLAVGYDLARRARWTLGPMAAVALAGFVPFLAFVVERSVTRRVEAELRAESTESAARAEPGPPPEPGPPAERDVRA